MAFLWWNSSVWEISEALAGVGELKTVVTGELRRRGFRDVRSNQQEIAGGKGDTWVSIAHLQIAPRRYWEVVMASGDSANTRAVHDEVVGMLRSLRFL